MTGSILIVSHNNLSLTKRAVNSALQQDCPCDVLVVDNYSTDGTVDWLKSKSGVSSISLGSNGMMRALSYCWNKGLKFFFRAAGRSHVLVCNNDIELRGDAYRLLLETEFPFVTCVSVDSVGQVGIVGDRSVQDLVQSARPHPDFSSFLISKTVFESVGLFDMEYYPAYYEDNDYHVRMHRAGITAQCVDLPFLHYGAQTLKHASESEKILIRRCAMQNREKFYGKYGCYPGTVEYEALFTAQSPQRSADAS